MANCRDDQRELRDTGKLMKTDLKKSVGIAQCDVPELLPYLRPQLIYTPESFLGEPAMLDGLGGGVDKDKNYGRKAKSVMVTNDGREGPVIRHRYPRWRELSYGSTRPLSGSTRPLSRGRMTTVNGSHKQGDITLQVANGKANVSQHEVHSERLNTRGGQSKQFGPDAVKEEWIRTELQNSLTDVRLYRAFVDQWDECQGQLSDITDQDKPGDRRNLKDYHQRLATFTGSLRNSWPRAVPTAESLAIVGFVYLGQETEVECFVCAARISEWDDGKEPLVKHFSQSPNCSFLHENFKTQLEALSPKLADSKATEKYSNNSIRLHSFSNWPLGHIVTSYQLASVGFYYPGRGRMVCCFSCGLKYDQWKPGDVPLLIHRKQSPFCKFLEQLITKGSPTPIPVEPPHPSLSQPQLLPRISAPPRSLLQTDLSAVSRPDYANESVRLKSFKYLPRDFPCSRTDCAQAGLYFVKKPDIMRCFSCDVVVRDWVPGDIPAEKHREVFLACKFLREFFPTKMESEPSDETVDPSTLPEPQFTRQDLEQLSHTRYTPSQLQQSFGSLSLSDPQPYPSLPVPYTSAPSSIHRPYFEPSAMRQTPLRPHPREEYVIPSPLTTPAYQPPSTHMPYQRYSLATPSSVTKPALRPSYQGVPPQTSLPEGDSKLCVVCMDAGLEVAIVPCGHICVCENCSTQISLCPMCRQPIDRAMKIFFPY